VARRIWRLPFRGKLRLARALLAEPRVPLAAKLLIPLLAVYLALPLDLIPDFIPVLGQLDDLLVAGVVLWLLRRLTAPEVIEEHVDLLAREAAAARDRTDEARGVLP
jgi:uncharacterized membrane protein YkvA (DUF1232 family)